MKIYAYYDTVFNGNRNQEEAMLLEQWKVNWRSKGWEPLSLNTHHATAHPRYIEWLNKMEKLPTVNPKRYENACFMRWMAMHTLGGGWMVDYDVYNLGLEPIPLTGFVLACAGGVPCMVHIDKLQIEAVIDKMLSPENVGQHYSDQEWCQKNPKEYGTVDMVKNYPLVNGYAVHCSNDACAHHGKTKYEAFRQLIQEYP